MNYMVYVLYNKRKRGWLISCGILVGIPLPFAFLSTGSIVFKTGFHFRPLQTFYLDCHIMRLSAGEWIGDASPLDELWTERRNAQDRLNE